MELSNSSDEELVVRLAQRDRRAFTILVERHAERFYACAYRYTHDQDEAEDVVQDSFLKIWRKPTLWKAGKGAKFTTWFYRIVVNAAIDKVRARKPHDDIEAAPALADERPNAFHKLRQKERQLQIEDTLNTLPERQKSALNLSYYEELSNKEAADVMGLGLKAFESLLGRARASMRQALEQQGILSYKEEEREESYG